MSLGYAVIREPGDELPVAERVIYRCFIKHVTRPPKQTSYPRAIMRTSRECGVSTQRVLEVIRSVNKEVLP